MMPLTACWAAKGGAGTTIVAAALGLLSARTGPAGALLVDLDGDLPAVLGYPDPPTGFADCLRDGPADMTGALANEDVNVAPGLGVLTRGTGPWPTEGAAVLTALAGHGPRPVIVDCGTLRPGTTPNLAVEVARMAPRSLLVIQLCYLSLRRALAAPVRATGAIVVTHPGRPLSASHVEYTLNVPVVATVAVDTAVSNAVDSGLLSRKVPRLLARALRDLAQHPPEPPSA